MNKNLNFRISGQKLHPQTSVKYLGVPIDEHLTFHTHLKTQSGSGNVSKSKTLCATRYSEKHLLCNF